MRSAERRAAKVSEAGEERLTGARRHVPQYRLLVGDTRVFYDVNEEEVEVLAIVPKPEATEWLEEEGVPE